MLDFLQPRHLRFKMPKKPAARRVPQPRDIETMDVMHINRLYSIIYKWADKGWVEWGVSARYAWVTQEGIVALMERLKVSDPK